MTNPIASPTRPMRAQWLWSTVALLGVILGLGAWAVSSPVGSSPDDDFHLASIWCGLGDRADLCESSSAPGEKLIDSGLNRSACYAMQPKVSAGCQETSEIFTNSSVIESSRGSFSANYPPIYYASMSVFASPDIPTSALIMRFANILVFVLSFVALWLLLPRGHRRVLFWMWAATIVPLGAFLVASNNPSSWAITGVGTAWFALYVFMTAVGRRKFWLGVLFFAEVLIASGARADAGIYTIIGSLAVVALTWKTSRAYLLGLILPATAGLMSLFLFATSQQSAVAATGLADSSLGSSTRSAFGVLAINLVQLPELWVGAFGYWGLGWLDTAMPGLVWISSAGIFAGLIFLMWGALSRRRLLTLGALAAILYFLPLYVLQRGLNHVGEQVQPRYLLPLIVVFAGIAFLGLAAGEKQLSRVQLWVSLLGLTAANSLALYVNIKRYVSGLDNGNGFSLEADIQWWWAIPLGPMAVWIIGSLGFALALYFGYRASHKCPDSAAAGDVSYPLETNNSSISLRARFSSTRS
jgi:hypothetical protein